MFFNCILHFRSSLANHKIYILLYFYIIFKHNIKIIKIHIMDTSYINENRIRHDAQF